MAEEHKQLRADVAELRRQLETTPNLDSGSRALIERVVADVERILAGEDVRHHASEGAAAPGRGSLAARMAEVAKRFEATHPTLSGTVGSVIDALAQMGI